EGVLTVQRAKQVLGAAFQPGDRGSGQDLDEVRGQGKAQVRAAGLDARQSMAFQHGREAAPHCLDLGEFGHAPPKASKDRLGTRLVPRQGPWSPAAWGLRRSAYDRTWRHLWLPRRGGERKARPGARRLRPRG